MQIGTDALLVWAFIIAAVAWWFGFDRGKARGRAELTAELEMMKNLPTAMKTWPADLVAQYDAELATRVALRRDEKQ